jgi:hypothetical protein
MANSAWGAIDLDTATTGSLDDIHHSSLLNGDFAIVGEDGNNVFYFYTYNTSSAAADSSPDVIKPESNAGNGRWLLSSMYIGDLTYAQHTHASAAQGGNIGNATTGNLTTGSITSVANLISMGADTDITNILGKAKIGYDTGTADRACFAHYDQMNTTDYALGQHSDGDVFLNCPTGKEIYLMNNDTQVGYFNASGLTLSPSSGGINLTTGGTLKARSNTDTMHELGRAKIGYNGTNADTASFAHYDNMNSTDYAVRQLATGATYLNSKTGSSTLLRINNVTVASIAVGGLSVNTGVLLARSDTDTTHQIGRCSIGYDTVNGDYATFSHIDSATTSGLKISDTDGVSLGCGVANSLVLTAGVTERLRVEATGLRFNNAGAWLTEGVLDEDNMASDSAVGVCTQQSIKAYVDSQVGLVGGIGAGSFTRGGFAYAAADQISLYGAAYTVKDYTVSWTSTLTKSFAAMDGSSWYYIYLDYSALSDGATVTATEVIYSTTAPTWNTTYNQWMNGDDRCIFAVKSIGAAAIYKFEMAGDYVQLEAYATDVNSATPSTTWTNATLTVPAFGLVKAQCFMKIVYSSQVGTSIQWRTDGSSSTAGETVGVTATELTRTSTTNVIANLGIVEYRCSLAGTETCTILTFGWYMPNGM